MISNYFKTYQQEKENLIYFLVVIQRLKQLASNSSIQHDTAMKNQTLQDLWNNLTSVNDSFEVRVEIPTLDLDEVIVCCVINLIIEVFGNGLLILMIITEKFLMDPQKRTVINQLITHLNYHYLLNNLVAAPLLTYIITHNKIGKIL